MFDPPWSEDQLRETQRKVCYNLLGLVLSLVVGWWVLIGRGSVQRVSKERFNQTSYLQGH